ncbi:Utp14-domain-containing protein [Mollisia scopiformis]|uniref:Utp14-domain-containing protein n=1 Tax=Mollisia scopiformis TaxID=149040 RepID=A0A194XNJ8_MOLSC|nr:Utp14-domain-containing protein [Mollisia scopiformis]KUJ21738.1 Utp14-domain-containing protein [Mollisia scopiformis]
MPGRQSHGRAPAKKPKLQNKSKKRALDAFSIASHENPDRLKVRQHRLGAQEGGNRPNKRRKTEEDGDDEEEDGESKPKQPRKKKGRFDELDIEEGSDSEGNEWKLGQVDSDDDSDLDSDEAFGESDEDRFHGYAFSGSTKEKSKKKAPRGKTLNLDEDDVEESDSELEEGDLGEDAVDLATMLDMASDEDEEMGDQGTEGSSEDDEEDGSDADSSISSAGEDDETSDPAKLAALQNMIANLPQAEEGGRSKKRGNEVEGSKLPAPAKLTLEDMMSGITDAQDRKALKFLESASSKKKARGKLEVPLAKRQQDRLDRSAAYDKTKETLDRWTDTVKHNRRADHLMFPLPDNEAAQAKSNKELVPTNTSKPFNELEATIQSILEESGLAAAHGKDDEDHIREFEELETNKLSMEEVRARRDQLRMARELLFREEAKAKRIKKIKSKSYRKVHRKQREKEERLNQEALAEGGFVPSEDELEAQDRRRAQERMGAKHRGSRWAKAMKETGQAAWNEDARSGITEMAQRDEELRKRVEGRAVRREFENGSDEPFDDSDDMSEDDDAVEQDRLMRQLKSVAEPDLVDESLPGARLANMDFMRKADAARKKQNDAMVEDIRRELAGEDTPSEEEESGLIGRRVFGPGSAKAAQKKTKSTVDVLEIRADSEEDEAAEVQIHGTDRTTPRPSVSKAKPSKPSLKPTLRSQPVEPPATEGGAWSKVPLKSATINDAEAKRRRHKKNNAIDVEELDLSQAAVIASKPKAKKPQKTTTLEVESDSDDSDENAVHLPFAIRDQELIKRAFAGADVVGEFQKEKEDVTKDEDDKVVDDTLPGWGSWVGDGLSKKEKAENKGKVLRKIDGIKPQDRKDAKLDRVIINEKQVKKNNKYLASQLPHTFETKQQYERSLRLPIGPEWTTKETFQDATKPRILLKQGVIAPMSKPLL